MTYEPKSTWVNGIERSHPVFRREFVAEMHRLLKEVGIDPRDADKECEGGIAACYEEHYKNPAHLLELLQTAMAGGPIQWPDEPAAVEKLWRAPRATRKAKVRPFLGKHVRLERWVGRVAAKGDHTYVGMLIAVATSTLDSSADLVILDSDEGTTWAISLAQVAFLAVTA